ncbi:hypothetical protein H0H81_007749 [Sphagnurus paluster]|uniref:Cytochrome b561 domain-containing protein n=1 Tax=Sphagnurus paluster TaxID=117069 RepID=A0A9P7K4G1_9AGAR|nr:hypothetical protein H0H81_007749 [Sphagnurus paluster]
MANTPMVIMWENSGKVVLSQRSAPGEVMPTVDSNPPRVATFAQSASSLAGDKSKFAFTIPSNSNTMQALIYAYGTDAPGSSAVDATLREHSDYGTLMLNLGGSNASDNVPLSTYERLIIAHAFFMVVGFLLLLPAGALVARYFRTFTPTWFKSHWIIQFLISGPIILTGIALGFASVWNMGGSHFSDWHMKFGAFIFALYLVQLALGAIIHFVKSANRVRRPPQNYLHAVLGLLIIGLATIQIHDGYSDEWEKTTGRNTLPNYVNTVFYVWIGVVTAAYFGGLALLPKQFRQENQPKRIPIRDHDDFYQGQNDSWVQR